MRGNSSKQTRASSNFPGEWHPCRKAEPVSHDLSRKRASEIAEFLEIFNALASVNQALLLSIEQVVESIRAPGAQPLIEQIAGHAERISSRMALMERLAAELKASDPRCSPRPPVY
jgi:hypothetical protein